MKNTPVLLLSLLLLLSSAFGKSTSAALQKAHRQSEVKKEQQKSETGKQASEHSSSSSECYFKAAGFEAVFPVAALSLGQTFIFVFDPLLRFDYAADSSLPRNVPLLNYYLNLFSFFIVSRAP